MAKPHAAANTQRPSTARSAAAAAAARATAGPSPSDPALPTPTSRFLPRADISSSGTKPPAASTIRSSVGSSSPASAADFPAPAARDIATVAKEVAKCLAYDDDSAVPTAASVLQPILAPEGLAGDPEPEDDASSTTVVSASPADALTDSADSIATQVAAPGDSTTEVEGRLLTEMKDVLAELGGARGLSPRSKRLLTALVQVADAELTNTALPMRRAALWRKVRVGILAVMVLSVAAMDVALAVALFGARRGNGRYHHVLPPT